VGCITLLGVTSACKRNSNSAAPDTIDGYQCERLAAAKSVPILLLRLVSVIVYALRDIDP
jgi:hypothetical protein